MDAKERLRRYLEQRRELGESELVLDSLSVEDVLRMLGAAGSSTGSSASSRPPDTVAERPPAQPPEAPTGDRAPEERTSVPPSAAGGAEPPARAMPSEGAADWRETLRAAGGAPDQIGGRGRGARHSEADMARAKKTVSPNVTGDRARDAATARRGTGARSDEGMDQTPAPGAATPERGEGGRAPTPRRDTSPIVLTGIDAPAGLAIGDPNSLAGGAFADVGSLDEIAELVAGCQRCPLYAGALNPVPGEGNPNADLVCIGEAPGQNEDESGRPFVGASGQLLTKILAAINLAREDVFIANVLKHRPPGNRNPKPDEVEACSPYLVRQIELVQPKVLLTFGTFAAQTLLNTKQPIGKLRGAVHRYYGIPLVVTYHPAALLRNPAWKRPTWEDVQLARRILDRATRA